HGLLVQPLRRVPLAPDTRGPDPGHGTLPGLREGGSAAGAVRGLQGRRTPVRRAGRAGARRAAAVLAPHHAAAKGHPLRQPERGAGHRHHHPRSRARQGGRLEMRTRVRLSVKFVLPVAVLIVLTSVTLGWFFISHDVQLIARSLVDRGTSLVRNLAYHL